MSKIYSISIYFGLLLALGLSSCKKDAGKLARPGKPGGDDGNSGRTEQQIVLDSLYKAYKKLSYWEEFIEVYQPVCSLTDRFNSPNSLLNFLRGQTPYHAAYRGPIDRFSWIEDLTDTQQSDQARADLADGYGMYMTFDGSRGDSLFVYFVEGGSPAAQVGMKRGDKVIQMQQDSAMVYSNLSDIESYILDDNLSITVEDASGRTHEYDLQYRTYDIDPLLLDTVFVAGGSQVGYLALSSFEELWNQNSGAATNFNRRLEAAFDHFEDRQVDELILDLRYNGGGYVSTATHLLNKVINAAGDGEVMFHYDVNKNLEKERELGDKEFADEVFKRDNNLDLSRIYFLVSEGTASASEIVISALMPYMDVRIIADGDRTYGKPVGFFREDISEDIGLWAASFKIVNKDGYTDYWDGIPANISGVFDNFYLDFRDPQEDMIRAALLDISGQSQLSSTKAKMAKARGNQASSDAPSSAEQHKLNVKPLRGMFKK